MTWGNFNLEISFLHKKYSKALQNYRLSDEVMAFDVEDDEVSEESDNDPDLIDDRDSGDETSGWDTEEDSGDETSGWDTEEDSGDETSGGNSEEDSGDETSGGDSEEDSERSQRSECDRTVILEDPESESGCYFAQFARISRSRKSRIHSSAPSRTSTKSNPLYSNNGKLPTI